MFGHKKDGENSKLKASKRIVFEMLEDNDEKAASLVDKMRDGSPLVINFTNLDPVSFNKMLAFFCGASYALDGESILLKGSVYLFARKVEFLDGSLKEFIDTYKK